MKMKMAAAENKGACKGDMTWVVDLPEGSRPGRHVMMVPEGEVYTELIVPEYYQLSSGRLYQGQETRTAHYLVHPLRMVSEHISLIHL